MKKGKKVWKLESLKVRFTQITFELSNSFMWRWTASHKRAESKKILIWQLLSLSVSFCENPQNKQVIKNKWLIQVFSLPL